MINVYYIVPSVINSGPIRVVLDIVKKLNRKEFNPTIIALSKHEQKQRYCKEWFEDLGVSVIEYSYSRLQLHLKSRHIAKEIQKSFPQNSIFHAHGYYPTRILSYMNNTNSVVTLHNISGEDFVMSKGKILGKYMSYSYLKSLKHIDMSVAISHSVEKWYRQKTKGINLSTVYNGVDIDMRYFNENITNLRQAVREELNIGVDTKVLIYPASFNIRKNHIHIIKELRESQKTNFVVCFVGRGPTEQLCQQMVEDDKRFIFLGYKMDVFKYYIASDYLITSSKSEGFGLVLAEAMAYGLPCIVSDIPVHKELVCNVFESTENLVFSLARKGDLRTKVEISLDIQYDKLQIQKKSQLLYSSSVMTKGYEDIYINLLT